MTLPTLGKNIKEGKNQKTFLRPDEEHRIIETFNAKTAVDDFSVVVSYDEIEAKNYSLSAGQYIGVKIDYVEITEADFEETVTAHQNRLNDLFEGARKFEKAIATVTKSLRYEKS